MTNLFERQTAIRQFAVKYGLFGLMTALPTTPDYVIKHGIESMWNIENDRVMMALAMTMTDKPTIIWDFHSLLLGIQMMFSFMLTDSKNPIRLCRHCTKAFVASRPSAVFCSPQCKVNIMFTRAGQRKRNQKIMDGMVRYNG